MFQKSKISSPISEATGEEVQEWPEEVSRKLLEKLKKFKEDGSDFVELVGLLNKLSDFVGDSKLSKVALIKLEIFSWNLKNELSSFEGLSAYENFEEPLLKLFSAIRERELAGSIQKINSASLRAQEFHQIVEESDVKLEEIRGALDKQAISIDRNAEFINGSADQIDQIKQSMIESFSLSSAAELWKNHGEENLAQYNKIRKITTFSGVVIVLSLIVILFKINWDELLSGGFATANIIKGAIIILTLSISLIAFRTLLRITLSRLQLQMEIDNKQALTSIYFSMLDEHVRAKQNVSDEQRAIVLASIFRPLNIGIIHEEKTNIDPSIVAAISKVLSR